MTFTYPLQSPVQFFQVPSSTADRLLVEWRHYLGEQGRPFGREDWALVLDGVPVAIACSASIVSSTVAGFDRREVVELARLCRHPDVPWVTRVALRLWREVAAPRWQYWTVRAAIAYSQNGRGQGQIYRLDGWTRVSGACGTSLGGGTWTRKRDRGEAAVGDKTLWLWHYAGPGADLRSGSGLGTTEGHSGGNVPVGT